MSKTHLWETINEALNPDQRKELNTIISSLKCMASSLFLASQGQECRERNIGMGLKLLTDQIPGLEEPGADASPPQPDPGAAYEPTESELDAFRREVLCDLRETNASYEECAIELGITPERAELDYADMVSARIDSLSASHPYGLEKPPLQDLVKCAARRTVGGRLLGGAQWRVMWPYTEWPYPYDPEDEASELISDLLSALTIHLPRPARESMEKRRRERLFAALQRFPQHDNRGSSSLSPDQRELVIRNSGGLRGRRPSRRGTSHGTSAGASHSSRDPSSKVGS